MTPEFLESVQALWRATRCLLDLRLMLDVEELQISDVELALRTLPGYDNYRMRWSANVTLDSRYWACDRDTFLKIARIIRETWGANREFIYEIQDCDDFAWQTKALISAVLQINTVGMVVDFVGHAYNVVVFRDRTASLYEPQIGFGQQGYGSVDGLIAPGTEPYWQFQRGMILL